jgi:signal transduction histidine kinase
MSFKLTSFRLRLEQRVSFRLTLWYAAFLVGSLALGFTILDYNLSWSMRRSDTELLTAKLKELTDAYVTSGMGGVHRLSSNRSFGAFFVRVADTENHTLFSVVPNPGDSPAIVKLEHERHKDRISTVRISTGTLQIISGHTKEGMILQVGRSTLHQQAFIDHFRREVAAVVLPMLALGVGGGAFLAYRALEPLHRLNLTAREIMETGKVNARLSETRTVGELRELVVSFNRMLDRIESLIAAMRGAIDNVAHDLRTPLTRLRTISELALQTPNDPGLAQEALVSCVEESERIVTLLNTLMDISEIETGTMRLNLKIVDFPRLVREAAEIYEEIAEEKEISLVVETEGEQFFVLGDPNRLRQAVANLIDNAIKYTPCGGCVRVAAGKEGEEALCRVTDTGIGIPEAEQSKIWTRLYRGDASRSQRGLGLGLSMVAATMLAHKGQAEVASTPGKGSVFTLRMPIHL